MIKSDGWLDWAQRVPGPATKQAGYAGGATVRHGKGAVAHSAVGDADSLSNVLMGTAQKSWHLSNLKSGVLWMHYPITAICWHAGSLANQGLPNKLYVGIENEGGPIGNESEPLTEAQIENLVHIFSDLSAFEGWPGYVRGTTLHEHNAFVATACPSGRIPWDEILRRLQKPSAPEPLPMVEELKFLVDLGYYITHEWDFSAMQPWQKRIIQDWARRSG